MLVAHVRDALDFDLCIEVDVVVLLPLPEGFCGFASILIVRCSCSSIWRYFARRILQTRIIVSELGTRCCRGSYDA
jgi:hypothetical protein